MCRDKITRKFILPKTSILDPKGVYILKVRDTVKKIENDSNGEVSECDNSDYRPLYMWKGKLLYFLY